MIRQACHVTQNKSPTHSPISKRKEIRCPAVVTCSRFWRGAMHFSIASDLNNSAVSCFYGPTIEEKNFFSIHRNCVSILLLCVAMQMCGFLSPLGYTQGQKGATLTFYMFHSCTQGHRDAIMLFAHKTHFDRVYISHL